MMIGTRDSRRSARQTSRPEPSGSIRSSRTRSGASEPASSSASAAVRATVASKPSRASDSASGVVIDSSSSTRRTVRLPGRMSPRHAVSVPEAASREWMWEAASVRAVTRLLPRDEGAAHALLGVVAHAAPVLVADALAELRDEAGGAALAEHTALERLAAAAHPEVVRVVARVADDERHRPRLRPRRERDRVLALGDADRLSVGRGERRQRQHRREGDCERRAREQDLLHRVVSSLAAAAVRAAAAAVVAAAAAAVATAAPVVVVVVVVPAALAGGCAGAARVVAVLGLVARAADVLARLPHAGP